MTIPSIYERALSGRLGGPLAQPFGALNPAATGRSPFAGINGNDHPRGTPKISFLGRPLILSLFAAFALQAAAVDVQASTHNARAPLDAAKNSSTMALGTLAARSGIVDRDFGADTFPYGKTTDGAAQPAAHTAEAGKVFVFYDPSIAGLGDALKRRPGVTLIPLKAGEPFAQIADTLEGQTAVRAIHVITHGEEGGIKIDGNLYSSIQGDTSNFARIKHALAPGADILLYGCNIAKGIAGQAYLQLVARLTGADLAASTDEVRISPNAAPPEFIARSGSIEAAPLHFGTWQGLLWNAETGEGGWYADANAPSGQPALNPRAASVTNPSLPGGVRLSTMGNVQTGGASTTFSIVAVPGASAMRLVHSSTNPTTYAASVAAGNYFRANLVVGGTTGAALSRMTYNQVSSNTAGAQFQLALYDTVTTTLTPISSAFTVSGSAVTQNVPFITPLTGMVAGRTYELRWYGLNCGTSRTCFIDNPTLYTQLNQAPTATNNALSTASQTAVSGNFVTANNGSGVDSDPESQVLTVDQINGAAFTVGSNIALSGGTLVITNANGAFTFTPSAGFSGPQTFTYRVNDGFGLSSTATVTITVAPSIVPVSDTGTATGGTTSTPVANVRINDTINGVAATSANSTIAQSGTWPAGISLNTTTGAITATAAVAPGTYSVAYQLCDRNTPANCATVTNTITIAAPRVDLAITKTNGMTTVVSGTTTTYAITITNNGPDAVTGAVVTDIPGSGIICPSANAVTIVGSGAPSGSFTVGSLTGAGIVLQTVPSGGSTTLTFSCEVN